MIHSHLCRLAFLFALFIWTAAHGLAQSPAGTISGQVVDETGGALPGAAVTLREPGTGRERVRMTDASGRFSVSGLPPGSYALTVTLSGFETLTREALQANGPATPVTPVTLVMKLSTLRDSVVVRGTARNVVNSIAGKRAADGIMDMVSTDEMGRLPDKNIGETLNRIPGVSMLLEKGEGRFVQIRGISPRLNNVTINGLAIGNAETESGGRLLPLDVLGGELLSGVQVFKTPTPDMDGQGIGGTLNLITKQPFDFANRFTMLVSTRAGSETIDQVGPTNTKEVPYTMDVTLTGKTANQRFGWLAGSSFSNRYTPLLGLYNDNWRTRSLGGRSVTYPTNVKNNVTVTGRERLNVSGAIEARPTATAKLYLRSFVAQWDEIQLRNRYDQGLGDGLTSIISNNSGVIASDRVQVNLRNEVTDKRLFSTVVGGTNLFRRWSVDYALQRTDNLVDEPNDNWEFRSGAGTFGPDTFVIDDQGAITITSPGRDRKDPALQGFRRVRYFKQRTDEDAWIGTASVRRDMVMGGRMPAFLKFGGRFSQTTRQTEVSQPSYNIGTLNWNLSQVPGGHLGGFDNPVPMLTVPNLWLDLKGLNAFFDANRSDPRYFALDAPTTYLNEHQSDFTLREQVGAAFAMGRIDIGKARLIGGVRAETTAVESSAFTILDRGGQLSSRPVTGTGSYTTWLPSIVGTFDLRRDLIARAAFSTSVGRPEFDAIAPRSRLGIEDNPTIGTIGYLSIGNPELKARESKNYDVALEWYFDEGSLASVSVFRKDISNEIIPAPTKIHTNYSYLGQTFNRFEVNTTVNAETADVNGVELSFADRFGFLPGPLDGLGFAGSLTLIDSGVRVARGAEVLILPLLQQADRSTSATLYYQRGPLDLSTTYKYNANFLTDYGDSRALDLDQGSFGRWDMRVQFDVTRDLKFIVDGINLNDRPTREFQGGMASQITEHEYTGRTFMFGISARFGRR
jgi:TonB-dependent receptor